MEVEDAVKLLRSHGLDEADARFEVALARGEVDGDLIPVREGEAEGAVARRDRNTA